MALPSEAVIMSLTLSDDSESVRRRVSAKNSSRVRLAFWVGDEDEVTVGGVRSIQASSSSNEAVDNLDPSSDTLRKPWDSPACICTQGR